MKTQTVIEIDGQKIEGKISHGKYINENGALSNNYKWTAEELKKLRENLNELIPLFEVFEVAAKLTKDDDDFGAVDNGFLTDDDWDSIRGVGNVNSEIYTSSGC